MSLDETESEFFIQFLFSCYQWHLISTIQKSERQPDTKMRRIKELTKRSAKGQAVGVSIFHRTILGMQKAYRVFDEGERCL